jgi:predicted unusual protein kinase regulating ubiquinone biosynthesis (AarF/ABC1/UbiB family)
LSTKKKRIADEANDQAVARIVFQALCTLRGTALKAAQLIAMEMQMIPEAYRRELAKASSQVPPMNRALTYQILKRELGPPEKVFQHFDLSPFAAASLGQVHEATTFDGRRLAVKVQYPGMAEGVKADVDMLKRVLAQTRYRRIFHTCFDEITCKVLEELDYKLEAQQTMAFRKCCTIKDIVIPNVATEFTTANVLSLERLDGLHLDAWLATHPSQAKRDHFGQLLVDFFHHGILNGGAIHADPHPGNYLFCADGRLGVIDFGCVKRLEPHLIQIIQRLNTPSVHLDLCEQETLHRCMGIHYRAHTDEPSFARFFTTWVKWLSEPYQQEVFDFGANHNYFQRGAGFAKTLYGYIDHYDGSFLYYGRAEHGLMRLLERLGARVRMRL